MISGYNCENEIAAIEVIALQFRFFIYF